MWWLLLLLLLLSAAAAAAVDAAIAVIADVVSAVVVRCGRRVHSRGGCGRGRGFCCSCSCAAIVLLSMFMITCGFIHLLAISFFDCWAKKTCSLITCLIQGQIFWNYWSGMRFLGEVSDTVGSRSPAITGWCREYPMFHRILKSQLVQNFFIVGKVFGSQGCFTPRPDPGEKISAEMGTLHLNST